MVNPTSRVQSRNYSFGITSKYGSVIMTLNPRNLRQ